MHNLAISLLLKGYKITGSDDEIFDPAAARLKKYGIFPEKIGWDANNITSDIDAVILSERRLTRWLKDIFSKYNSAVNRPFTESITNDIQALLTQMSESRSLY